MNWYPRTPLDRQRAASLMRSLYRGLLLLLFYQLVSSFAFEEHMERWAFLGDGEKAGLEHLIDRTGYRPLVYRVASPFIVGVVSDVALKRLPPGVQDFLVSRSPALEYRWSDESWNERKAVRFHVAYLYTFLAYFAVILAGRYLLISARIGSRLFQDIAPAVALCFIPLTQHYGAYIYDMPELMLLLLATAFALQGRWWLYYPVFVLAVLNKESNVVLGVTVGAVWLFTYSPSRLAAHAAAHAALGLALLIAVRGAFAESPGVAAVWAFPSNIQFWTSVGAYTELISGPAALIPVPNGANMINIGLALFGMFAYWKVKPSWLRRLVIFMAGVNAVLQLLWAMADELRNLSLMFPALFLATCFTVVAMYSGMPAARAAEGHLRPGEQPAKSGRPD